MEYKPKNRFVKNAKRIRCIRVTKRVEFGKERATAFVVGDRLHAETGEVIQEGITIRVRDCIEFWQDYVNERQALYGEEMERARIAEEQRERVRKEHEERMRIAQEQREARAKADQERRDRLVTVFRERTGIPEVAIAQISETHVTLDRTSLELWLSSNGHDNN